MTISEEIQPLSDRPARHCAICGARVADTAKTCLICGSDLDIQEKVVEQPPPPEKKKFPIIRIAILVVIAILILTGSVIIGLNLADSDVTAELPTFTATLTSTATITPSPTFAPTSTSTPIMPTPTPQPPEAYTVQEGDTPSDIAAKYGLTTEILLTFNELSETDIIVVGQKLLIPVSTPTPGPSPTLQPGEPTATLSPFLLHTVKAGDSLSTIAEQYQVDIATIKAANNIPEDSDSIQTDQVLTIPVYTPTPEPEPNLVFTITPTPGIMTYAAPLMLYPPNKAKIAGNDSPVTLQWASVGILTDREYYNVELIIATENDKKTYNAYVRSTVWRIPQEWLQTDDVTEFSCTWRVHVVRQVTESVDANYKIISTTVARRSFTLTPEINDNR